MRDRPPPYPTRMPTVGRPPRPAAAVIVLREDGPRTEVFVVRRNPKLRFLGGFGGYPGGRADVEDAALAGVEDRADPASLAITASRELFEEAGLLLSPGAGRLSDEVLDRERLALLQGETTFEELCRRHDLDPRPAPGALVPAGHWVTPYYSPLRYDTLYFVHRFEGPRQPVVWEGELVEGRWIEPGAVLDEWRRGETWLAPPVTETLMEIDRGAGSPQELVANLERRGAERGHPFHPVHMRHGIRLLALQARTLPPASFTNTYLVGEQELLVVDPGARAGEPRRMLLDTLGRLVDEGRRLRAVVLTHHHLDHVDAAVAVRERFGVPIAAHPGTAASLRAARQAPYRPELQAFEVDDEIEDGHRYELAGGFVVEVLHTPGHAQGHLCLLEHRLGTILAGDLVSGLSPVIIDPPEGDMVAYLGSLRRVIELGPLGLFPGHGPPAVDSRARLELLLQHRLWRHDKALEALRDAPDGLTFDELVPHVYDDVSPHVHVFAARSLLAHLEMMRDDGRVELDGERIRIAARA